MKDRNHTYFAGPFVGVFDAQGGQVGFAPVQFLVCTLLWFCVFLKLVHIRSNNVLVMLLHT